MSPAAPRRFRLARLACATLLISASACSSDTPNRTPPTAILTPPAPATGAGSAALPASGAGGAAPGGGAMAPAGGAMAAPAGTGAAGASGSAAPSAGAGGSATAGSEGTPTQGSTDWPMIGYDVGSTYWNRAETVLTKENAASLEEIWSADFGGNVYSAPLQVGDKIYAAGPSTVRAFDAASGNELWRVNHASTASLAYADGKLYLNNNAAQVVALNAADGSMLWMKQPDSAQRADGSSSPIPAGDVILIGGSNGTAELSGGTFRGYLAALDRMTGDTKWVSYTVPENAKGASIWSTPSADLAAGRAYGATGNNYGTPATDSSDSIIAFDLMSGAIIWKQQRTQNDTFGGFGGGPDYDFGANPVLYETLVDGVMTQVVAAGAKSGSAHGVRRDNGMLLWTRQLGSGTADGSLGIFVNSTWTGKNLLVAVNEGGPATLYALDGATGDIAWMRRLSGQVWGRISVANGVGFVGTGTTLEVFDVDSGAVLKSIPSKGGTVAGTVSIANGRVAFGVGLSWSTGQRGTMLTVLAVR